MDSTITTATASGALAEGSEMRRPLTMASPSLGNVPRRKPSAAAAAAVVLDLECLRLRVDGLEEGAVALAAAALTAAALTAAALEAVVEGGVGLVDVVDDQFGQSRVDGPIETTRETTERRSRGRGEEEIEHRFRRLHSS